jgi:ribosome-binding factor A
MKTRRSRRVADLLQTEIASYVLMRMSDPRLRWVTITRASVSADLKNATIFFTCVKEDQLADAQTALDHATARIRTHIGSVLHLRRVPELVFRVDQALYAGFRVLELLDEVVEHDVGGPELLEPGSDIEPADPLADSEGEV